MEIKRISIDTDCEMAVGAHVIGAAFQIRRYAAALTAARRRARATTFRKAGVPR
ncbi:MAG TPA: hypothetical protein VFR21_11585 [Bradyrhizobium sp.]|nr:hypothetical protein [Bradyrhizobium sp.]